MKTGLISITQFPKISAIYYGLLQSGYDYYSIERSLEHIDILQSFVKQDLASAFFFEAKQNTCEVYPYWPRAAILETASFYLDENNAGYQDYDSFYHSIISASNISEQERDDSLWRWIADFPNALRSVLSSDSFLAYMYWEKEWITEQNDVHRKELCLIRDCLDICISQYHTSVQDIQICVNPIKCKYSADYHLVGSSFVFSSGAFQINSIIHEFLHHVVHPVVEQHKDMIRKRRPVDARLDNSYYLLGSDAGILNAFEESVVRSLTEDVLNSEYPKNLSKYLENLLNELETNSI